MDLANRIAASLAKALGYDDEKRKVMAYGLGAGLQALLLLGLSLIFGAVFHCHLETMIIFWGVGLLRRTAGGVHSSTYMGCVMTSTLAIWLPAILCRYVLCLFVSKNICLILIAISFLFSAVFFYKRVPVEAPNKPIRKPEKIKRLRLECLGTTLVYLAVAVLFAVLGKTSRSISGACAICIVMLWQCFTLSSRSTRLVSHMDKLFTNT